MYKIILEIEWMLRKCKMTIMSHFKSSCPKPSFSFVVMLMSFDISLGLVLLFSYVCMELFWKLSGC
jgi:hypothetical protein